MSRYVTVKSCDVKLVSHLLKRTVFGSVYYPFYTHVLEHFGSSKNFLLVDTVKSRDEESTLVLSVDPRMIIVVRRGFRAFTERKKNETLFKKR